MANSISMTTSELDRFMRKVDIHESLRGSDPASIAFGE